jgi:hypothetical protein
VLAGRGSGRAAGWVDAPSTMGRNDRSYGLLTGRRGVGIAGGA